MSPYYFLFYMQYEFMSKARTTKLVAENHQNQLNFFFNKQSVLRLRNTWAIGCAKKTAENFFNS